MENIEEKVLEVLASIVPGVDGLKENKQLVHSGVLDSLGIVTLIGELSDNVDIAIQPQEITYENFDSVEGLAKMVERLSE